MHNIRNLFPLLAARPELAYLDSAATTHKPELVLATLQTFYAQEYASVHRGVYAASEHATAQYEQARAVVARFINAQPQDIVFTRGATESINIVAMAWAVATLKAGDEIVLSELEHHANLLPWQRVAQQLGVRLVFIPVLPDGRLALDLLPHCISTKTKLVAITLTSNALGTRVDTAPIVAAARAVGARVLIDAAQAVAHEPLDVELLEADFVAFSGHKMFGPTGSGVLYVTNALQETFPPYQLGGGMVYEADWHTASWRAMPHRLEAGTPSIAQALGLAAACTFMERYIDYAELRAHEALLTTTAIQALSMLPKIGLLGPIEQLQKQGHMMSFMVDGIHAHDVAAYLDGYGIAVRAGNHCAQPLSKRLGYHASVRVSFAAYSSMRDVERLIEAVERLVTE